MSGITNNNTPPTANTNRDSTELTQQKSARAVAFYQNNLELADPRQLQINRRQTLGSSSARAALQYARTTQISLTLQQQLAALDPAQFRITRNPSFYPPPPPRDLLPTDILPPRVWLDAADSTNFNFVFGTSNITTWLDKSGNGFHANAFNSPTYDAVNKRVNFNGSSQYMTNLNFSLNLQQRSLFFVIQQTGNPGQYAGIFPMIPNPTTGSDTGSTTSMSIETWNGGISLNANGGGYSPYTTGLGPIPLGIYNEAFSQPNGIMYRTGNVILSGTANFTFGTSGGYALAARWANGASGTFFIGNFREVLIFDSFLTTTQRQLMEGYLAWKWGLQAGLPSNHPYFNSKPPQIPVS